MSTIVEMKSTWHYSQLITSIAGNKFVANAVVELLFIVVVFIMNTKTTEIDILFYSRHSP